MALRRTVTPIGYAPVTLRLRFGRMALRRTVTPISVTIARRLREEEALKLHFAYTSLTLRLRFGDTYLLRFR